MKRYLAVALGILTAIGGFPLGGLLCDQSGPSCHTPW